MGRSWAIALSVLLLTLTIGCNGDGSGDGDKSTPTPTEPLPTATPARNIRDVDLTAQQEIVDFQTGAGGEIDADRIIYADLTGDGTDEAIVPVGSGGESGDIAVFVFGFGEGEEPEELLRAQPAETGMMVSITNAQLVTEEGAFAPGDPFGVPSQILRRHYSWDGQSLVIEREERMSAR